MITIADIPFPKSTHDENLNVELAHYRAELEHFIRRKPTRKMRVVKRFLDVNLRDPDQDAQVLERELSMIYNRFREEQKLKKKFNRLRPLKLIKKLKNGTKKKDYGDYSNFKEYHEYLELFADENCNLFDDLKTKEGKNAKIFTEMLLKARKKTEMPPLKAKSPLQSREKEKKSGKTEEFSNDDYKKDSSKNSAVAFNRDSSMILSMTYKGDAGGSFRDTHHKSFNQSSFANPITADFKLTNLKKQSPAETYFSSLKDSTFLDKSNKSYLLREKLNQGKKRVPTIEDQAFVDLKDKIVKHQNDRPRFIRKEVPFQFDKNFIGSRKLQEKKFVFDRRNGLLPRTQLSLSFGK